MAAENAGGGDAPASVAIPCDGGGGVASQVTPVTLVAKDFCYSIRKPRSLVSTCTRPSSKPSGSAVSANVDGATATNNAASRRNNQEGGCGSADRPEVQVILEDISLCVKPGSMLVVMGPSGSGKTTLLNALAGRSKASSRIVMGGTLVYKGVPANCPLPQFSTYIMQKDILPAYVTVGEYLRYFSVLKMPTASKQERERRIKEVLTSLNLYHCRDTRIGGSAHKSLSGGEIKRVSLAVELLNNPSLIFLDEPTSGLDAALAFDTVRLLLRLARSGGRTIVCTMHQPRSQLFAMFDELLLLSRGRVIYQGPATECCAYFSRLGYECPPHFNPADFLLDLLTVGGDERDELQESEAQEPRNEALEHSPARDSSESPRTSSPGIGGLASNIIVRIRSREAGSLINQSLNGEGSSGSRILIPSRPAEVAALPSVGEGASLVGKKEGSEVYAGELMRVSVPLEAIQGLPDAYAESQYCEAVKTRVEEELRKDSLVKGGQRNLQQMLKSHSLFWRRWLDQLRVLLAMQSANSLRNPLVFAVQVLLNFILALIIGLIFWDITKDGADEGAGRNLLGCLFFLASQIVFSPMDTLSLFCDDRELFNRDTANGNYWPSSFFVAKMLALFPFQHGPLTLMLILAYWMVGMTPDAGRFFLYLLIGQLGIFASVSFLILISALAPRIAVAQAVAPMLLVVLLLVCGFYIREQDIPPWISWLKYVSFIHYCYLCFAGNEFTGNPRWESLPPEFLEEVGGLTDTRLGLNMAILAGLGIVLRFFSFLALKYCNRRIGVES